MKWGSKSRQQSKRVVGNNSNELSAQSIFHLPSILTSKPEIGKWIFVDLEWTNVFNEAQCELLQICMYVTQAGTCFPILDRYGATIHFTHDELLNSLSDWSKHYLHENGLLYLAMDARISQPKETVYQQIQDFLIKHCSSHSKGMFVGCGVRGDYEFLLKHLPSLHSIICDRYLDISSFYSLVNSWCPQLRDLYPPRIQPLHLAENDVKSAVQLLYFYQQLFFGPDRQQQTPFLWQKKNDEEKGDVKETVIPILPYRTILPHHVWLWLDKTKAYISILATNSKLIPLIETFSIAGTFPHNNDSGRDDYDLLLKEFLNKNFPTETTTFHLAGICSTRLQSWIKHHWPQFHSLLHHVCIDFEPFVYMYSLTNELDITPKQQLASLLIQNKHQYNKIERDLCVGQWVRKQVMLNQ